MSIYITGDTHIPIDIHKLSTKVFKEQKNLTKDDFLIVCGDFGGVWDGGKHDKYWLDWLQKKNFSTLYVYGNHENFPLTESYPVEEWNKGKIHVIRKSIYHLINGEIFSINGKSFFVMGGASSHDFFYRTPGIDWWPEEIPFKKTMDYGLENLERNGNKVDYIISHCAPTEIQKQINPFYHGDILTDYLEYIYRNIEFDRWFCGHYHVNQDIEKVSVLYDNIVEII